MSLIGQILERRKRRSGRQSSKAFWTTRFAFDGASSSFTETMSANTTFRPSVPVNLQNLILAQVLLLVEGVSAHKPRERRDSNQRKKYGRKPKADNNAPAESSTVSSTEINPDIAPTSVSIDAPAVSKRKRDGTDDQGAEKKKRKTDASISVPTPSSTQVDSSVANPPVSTVNSKRKREVQEEQRSEKKQKTTPSEDAFVSPTNVHSIEPSNGDSREPPADVSDHADIPLPSPILKHLVVGINAVTNGLKAKSKLRDTRSLFQAQVRQRNLPSCLDHSSTFSSVALMLIHPSSSTTSRISSLHSTLVNHPNLSSLYRYPMAPKPP